MTDIPAGEVLATRRALAAKYGAKYNIPTELVCAVIEQESGWNPWAIRFEPAFEERYVRPLGLNPTQTVERSISWGPMQLMGQVARELGFIGNIPELCDPDTGVDWGCKKLRQCLDRAKGDEIQALLYWNGGSNAAYPAQVLARKSKYAM